MTTHLKRSQIVRNNRAFRGLSNSSTKHRILQTGEMVLFRIKMFFLYNISFNSAPVPLPEVIDPCRPSPCGINALCQNRNNAASCTCLPELFGDPYIECKPECSTNPECPDNKACLRNKCGDPCPGVCGSFASCRTQRHQPTCTCDPGYTGDPFRFCSRITTCKSLFYYRKAAFCNLNFVI